MNFILRELASFVPAQFIEKVYAHALHRGHFARSLSSAALLKTRSDMWADLSQKLEGRKILFVEMGVFKGESITAWALLNRNPGSLFVGFDTFSGLPEPWAGLPQGYFSTNGEPPRIDDPRVTFVRGLFQDTLGPTLRNLDFKGFEEIVVHFDADLFSSTVFSMCEIMKYTDRFYALFDEFTGDESRALYSLEKAFQLDIKWIAMTKARSRPFQVSCHIKRGSA